MADPRFNWDIPWPFVVALILLLAVFCVIGYFYLDFEDRRGKYVLLMGLPGSGKTSLFLKMRGLANLGTYTSMKANLASFKFPRDPPQEPKVHMVDIPGHDRVRGEELDKYARNSRGVVFVIDSAAFSKNSRDVAACMYSLLAQNSIRSGCVPVYVLCNKQDLLTAVPAETIRRTLESEMNTLRKTRSTASHLGEEEVLLGDPKAPFAFSKLSNRIMFEAGALENITAVCAWVRECVSKDHYNTLPNWLKPLAE